MSVVGAQTTKESTPDPLQQKWRSAMNELSDEVIVTSPAIAYHYTADRNFDKDSKWVGDDGYNYIVLQTHVRGKTTIARVDEMVAGTFILDRPLRDNERVIHLDGDNSNDELANLAVRAVEAATAA
jgi:hypothetical protein